jgi:hypothetical protein
MKVRITLKEGPALAGAKLAGALKRLVEIGRRLEREERDNGGGKSTTETSPTDRHRNQAG